MTNTPPPIPYATRDTRPRINPLAIAACIVGCVSILIPLLAPVGIVLGAIAMRKLAAKHERGKGLAIAGIATGCVGLLSAVMLVLALQRARTAAQQVAGMANLRQMGQAMIMYTVDNRGFLPPDFMTLARGNYLGPSPQIFVRPGSNDTPAAPPGTPPAQWASKLTPGSGSCSFTYALNGTMKVTQIRGQNTFILVYETTPPPGRPTLVLFADGHVEAIPAARWAPMLANLTGSKLSPIPQTSPAPAP